MTPTDHDTPPVASPTGSERSSSRPRRRLIILLATGLLLVSGSLLIRASDWARERRLKTLSAAELALAIHDTPNDPLTFAYYGSALLNSNQLEASEKAFQRAIDLAPKLHRAYVGLGTVQFRRGDLQKARESFLTASQLARRDIPARLGLAQTYARMGSPRSAIEPLKEIVKLQPKNGMAWYHLGKMYGDAKQSDLALQALQEAVRLKPMEADFWRDLGQVSRHYSRFDEAESHLLKAVAINPKDPITHYWLGQLYAQMGDTQERRRQAQTALKAAVKLDPRMPEGHFELAQLHERAGEWKNAVAAYRRAHELDPSHEEALYHLGLCLTRLGREGEGKRLIAGFRALSTAKREIENLENRIRAEPSNSALRLRIARVYRKYGNDEGALNQYGVYLRLQPDNRQVVVEAAAYRRELQAGTVAQKVKSQVPTPGPNGSS